MKKIILGALVALMACAQPMDAQERRGGPRRMDPEQISERLDKELDLTDEQEAKITAIYKEFFGQQPQERPSREEMRTKMKEMNEKIKAVLNDDQKKKFDEMQQKMRRRGPGGGPR